MVCIGLIIKGADFTISAAPVERLGFAQRFVRFETEQRNAPAPRELLQALQDAPANAEAARGWRDPHALDLAAGCMAPQRAPLDRLAKHRCQTGDYERRRE